MRSNLSIIGLLLLTTSCTFRPADTYKSDEDLIGTAVTQIARMTKSSGESKDRVIFFDEATRKIHQFEIGTFKHLGSYSVTRPDLRHYPFSDEAGNYIVDVASKTIGIIRTPSGERLDLKGFQGQPVSLAYHGPTHTLVIADDLASVLLVRLNPDGSLQSQTLLGGMLKPGVNFKSGDFGPDGRLILALTDNSIAVVDVTASLGLNKWIFQDFILNAEPLSWMAPVPGTGSKMLARSSTNILVFDVDLRAVTASVDSSGMTIERYGKSFDPHIVFTEGTSGVLVLERTVFSSMTGNEIRRDRIRHQGARINATELHLQKDLWTFMTVEQPNAVTWDGPKLSFESAWNFVGLGRRLVQRRLSDGLAAVEIPVEDNALVDISTEHLTRLYPSELGWASRTEIQSGLTVESKMFNLRHLGK